MKSEQGVYPVSKVTYIIRSTAFQRAQYIYVHPTETQSQWSAESLTSQCRKVASIQHKCKHSAAKLRLHNRLTLFLSISPLFFFFFFKKYHESNQVLPGSHTAGAGATPQLPAIRRPPASQALHNPSSTSLMAHCPKHKLTHIYILLGFLCWG